MARKCQSWERTPSPPNPRPLHLNLTGGNLGRLGAAADLQLNPLMCLCVRPFPLQACFPGSKLGRTISPLPPGLASWVMVVAWRSRWIMIVSGGDRLTRERGSLPIWWELGAAWPVPFFPVG